MKKVLIVDDDIFLTNLYAKLLQSEGLEVAVVNSWDEALNWLKASLPDLVVLDLHMPDMKGADVLRAIRNDERLQHLWVIIFATGYLKSLMSEVEDLGAHKVLSKMKCKPRVLVAEIKDSLALLEQAPPPSPPRPSPPCPAMSALERTAEDMEDPGRAQCSLWFERLRSDPRNDARRVCLLHIYKIFQKEIVYAMGLDKLTSEGKLGRALKKLMDDVYDHPHLIGDSTTESLEQALQKLQHLNAKTSKRQLKSEAMLKDVLSGLDS